MQFKAQVFYCKGLIVLVQTSKNPSFVLPESNLNRKHGLATFVYERVNWTLVDQFPTTSETKWLCVDIDEYKISNVYKPRQIRLKTSDIPLFLIPGVSLMEANPNPNVLMEEAVTAYRLGLQFQQCKRRLHAFWARINIILLDNPKSPASFSSGRWNKPGLAICQC